MNILHFTTMFLPQKGGTVTRIKTLTINDGNFHIFNILKNIVTLIDSSDHKNNVKFKKNNFKVIISDIHTPNIFISQHRIIKYIFSYFMLSKINIKNKIDIVEIHSPIGPSIAGLLYSLKNKKPFIYNCHGLIGNRLTNVFLKNILEFIEKKIIKLCSFVIVQTENEKNIIKEKYKLSTNKVSVIYNGVNINTFKKIYSPKLSNNIHLLYAGYLNHINGVDILLKWIKKHVNEHNNKSLKLSIFGKGPLLNVVKNYCKENFFIEYKGIISNEQMNKCYNQHDILLIPRPSLPSTESLLPLKLIEAMASGMIILASNVNPIKNVIINGENGFYYQKNDYHDFSLKLSYIIKNFNNLKTISVNARKTIENNYSLKKSRKRLKTLYNKFS